MNALRPIPEVVATNLAMYADGGNAVWKGRTKESISQVFVMPHIPRYQKPCQIYYYQTKAPIAKKYGIAADAAKRAKTGNRWGHYHQQLSVFDCSTRAEALVIESALGQYLTKKFSEEEYEEWADVTNMSSSELARESKEEFDSLIKDLQSQYAELGNEEFIRKNLAFRIASFERLSNQLLKGELVVFCVKNPNEYNDGSITWCPKEDIKEWDSSAYAAYQILSLEQVPEIFYQRYGFKLIPDSAWH